MVRRKEVFESRFSAEWRWLAVLALILVNLGLAPMARAVVILPCCFATNLLGGYCWLCPATGNDFPCASNENDDCQDCPPGQRNNGGTNNGRNGGGRGTGGRFGGGCATCSGDGPVAGGMPVWSVTEPVLNLWLVDKPIYYPPSRGREIAFELYYKNQLDQDELSEAENPQSSVYSLGRHWTTPWRAYLKATDDPNAYEYFNGRGGHQVISVAGSGAYQDRVSLVTLTNGILALDHPGGAEDRFSLGFIGDDGIARYYLTLRQDPYGNQTRLSYKTNSLAGTNTIYLDRITDVDGRITQLAYTNINGVQLVSRVTDPYSHVLQLAYDTNALPNLTTITDSVGIASIVAYNPITGNLASLLTPYSLTRFQPLSDQTGAANSGLKVEEDGIHQGVRNYFYLYSDSGDPTRMPVSLAAYRPNTTNLVAGYSIPNTFDSEQSHQHNTFFWGPQQYPQLPTTFRSQLSSNILNANLLQSSNYLAARMRHWLLATNPITTESSVSTTLSLERAPSPDGTTQGQITWYDYSNKLNGNPMLEGDGALPVLVAGVLPSGDTRFVRYLRNRWGAVTNVSETYGDVVGSTRLRTTTHRYSADDLDLIATINPLGIQVVSNQYNGNHRLVATFNVLNEKTSFTYDSSQRRSSIVLSSGLLVTNTYDTNGFLSRNAVVGYTTNFFTWNAGRVSSVTDFRGLTVTSRWDALGRLTSLVYPDGTYVTNTYLNLDRVTTTDRMGYVTRTVYDDFQNPIQIIDPSGRTNVLTYCDCGLLFSKMDPLGGVTAYTYDFSGRLLSTLFPDGTYTSNRWDAMGRIIGVQKPDGHWVTNVYNNQGRRVLSSDSRGTLTSLSYDILNRVTNQVDGNGVVVGLAYDGLNRLLFRKYPDGGVSSLGYSAGVVFPTIVTNTGGKVRLYAYNSRGYLTNIIVQGFSTNSFVYDGLGNMLARTDDRGGTTSWSYDIYGRLTNRTDGLGTNILAFAYDADGRATNRWTAAGGNISMAFDPVGNVTNMVTATGTTLAYAYDADNRLTSMLDPTGLTSWNYDAAGHPLLEDGPWASDSVAHSYSGGLITGLGIANPNLPGWIQSYNYDDIGRLAGAVSPAGSFSYAYHPVARREISQIGLPGGNSVTNTFDANGREGSTTLKNSSGTVLNGHSYVYNTAGQRTRQILSEGNYLDYLYDSSGALISAKGYESGGAISRIQEQWGYGYDAGGNLLQRTNNALRESLSVNGADQWVASSIAGSFTVSGTVTSAATNITVNGITVSPYGDLTFALPGVPVPTGSTNLVAIGRDARGRTDTNAVTVTARPVSSVTYTAGGSPLSDGMRLFDYDAFNQLIRITSGASNKVEFFYDGLFRRRKSIESAWSSGASNVSLVSVTNTGGRPRNDFSGWVGCQLKAGATPLIISQLGRYVLTGNSGSHVLKLVRSDGTDIPGASTTINLSGLAVGQFGYAPLTNPVILEANSVVYLVSQEFSGGDTWFDSNAMVFAAGAATVLGAVSAPVGSRSFTLIGGTNQTYGPVDVKFGVGAWNVTRETRYLYDGRLVVQERNGQNLPSVTYTRGADLQGKLSRLSGIGGLLARTTHDGSVPTHAYYHADAGGNITALVSSQGNLLAKYRYDPFGNLTAKMGPLADANLYRFSSQEIHPATGLYYYGFRYYDPAFQRWLTRDPVYEAGGLNLYQFVGNDPVNRTDRMGLITGPDYYEEPEDPSCDELLKRIQELIARRGTPEEAIADGSLLEVLMITWIDSCREPDLYTTASDECMEKLPEMDAPPPNSENRSSQQPQTAQPPSTFCSRNPEICIGVGVGIIGIGVGATCVLQPELCAIAIRVGIGWGGSLIPSIRYVF
jgi:RHS repeat-associated protein